VTKFICLFLFFIVMPVFADSANDESFNKMLENQAMVDNFAWESAKPFDDKDIVQIRKYGNVVNEEIEHFKTPYGDDATDHKIEFNGVYLEGFYIPKQKRFFLKYLKITTPNYPIANSLIIGSNAEMISKVMKHNGTKKLRAITYQGETEKVVFVVDNGKIVRIDFFYYTG